MERTFRRALTALAVSLGVSLGSASIAAAAQANPPVSGDPRAVAVAGNVTTCAGAGLGGEIIKVTSNITGNTYIDITAVPAGYQVTGVIVKGGPNYNKYLPAALGSLPWNDLHAPLVESSKPAEISHWFVCGKKKTTTTTTTKTTTKTTTTSTGASTSTSTGSSSSSTSSKPATTSSSAAVVVGAPNNTSGKSGLAQTGFSGGAYVLVGGLLLIGGVAALVLARRRRRV
ncbi:LPXTG cell wall anchor domain-containing protein [Kibdelosporangium aridum]|uniref:LPXTG cell wall anchor domain-containing protein n=1 Tax=Kibdelosporangium aridum TaxID=2030 RepID=UPI000526D0A6